VPEAGNAFRLLAASSGLASDTSAPFDIRPGLPVRLAFFEQPSDVAVNAMISPEVVLAVLDTEDNVVDTSTAWISLELDPSGNANLTGTTSIQADAGLAVFDDLSVSAAGTDFTLLAHTAGLSSERSTTFDVLDSEYTMIIDGGDGQQGTVGSTLPTSLSVLVRDGQSAGVSGVTVDFVLTQPQGASGGGLDPVSVQTGANGIASTRLMLGDRVGEYTVTATATGVIGSPLRFTTTAIPPPYPSTIALNHTWEYPSHDDRGDYTPLDYRIVGLPGKSGIDMTTLLQGGQNENWKLFTDDGSGGEPSEYLRAYDGSADFDADVGRAFWLLHRGNVQINRSVPSAPIDAGRNAVISIQAGWNLITNPFPDAIPWKKIQDRNQISDPIYRFDDVRGTADSFDPYLGYYYFNRDQRSELAVPYDSIFAPLRISGRVAGWTVDIRLKCGRLEDRTLCFGVDPDASDVLDKRDSPAPRGIGGPVLACFSHPEWDGPFTHCARDMRSEASERQEWTLSIETDTRTAVTLSFEHLDFLPPNIDLLLSDPLTRERFSLRTQPRYTVFTGDAPYTLTLQSLPAAVIDDILPSMPTDARMEPPYPNPTEHGAITTVVLPEDAWVEISVSDILGRTVRTIHAGVLSAGRHLLFWDGCDEHGSRVPSGPYFVQMRSGGRDDTSPPIIFLAQ
jgi:hypothetical protein